MSEGEEFSFPELAPNSSEAQGIYVPELPDQEREHREENAVMGSSLPIMEELIDWFGEQAAEADSVTQARATAKTNDITLEQALIVHENVAWLLKHKQDDLISRFSTYKNTDDMA